MAACGRYGGQVVQKRRLRLVAVGCLFVAALGLGPLWSSLWAPAVFLAMIGVYLLARVSAGPGRWCWGCNRFDGA